MKRLRQRRSRRRRQLKTSAAAATGQGPFPYPTIDAGTPATAAGNYIQLIDSGRICCGVASLPEFRLKRDASRANCLGGHRATSGRRPFHQNGALTARSFPPDAVILVEALVLMQQNANLKVER